MTLKVGDKVMVKSNYEEVLRLIGYDDFSLTFLVHNVNLFLYSNATYKIKHIYRSGWISIAGSTINYPVCIFKKVSKIKRETVTINLP